MNENNEIFPKTTPKKNQLKEHLKILQYPVSQA